MAETVLERRNPWTEALRAGRFGCDRGEPGIVATALGGVAIVNITARRGGAGALGDRLHDRLGLELPETGRSSFGKSPAGDDLTLAWDGPERWRVWGSDPISGGLARNLRDALGDTAAVVDQSHGHAIMRIAGRSVRELLAKGTCVDLHPNHFQTGDCAMTTIAHIALHLTQIDDRPAYSVQLFRSMTGSFGAWLSDSGSALGLEVVMT